MKRDTPFFRPDLSAYPIHRPAGVRNTEGIGITPGSRRIGQRRQVALADTNKCVVPIAGETRSPIVSSRHWAHPSGCDPVSANSRVQAATSDPGLMTIIPTAIDTMIDDAPMDFESIANPLVEA